MLLYRIARAAYMNFVDYHFDTKGLFFDTLLWRVVIHCISVSQK